MADVDYEPRKRRTAAKPPVKDLSDSEDDLPKKRPRRKADSEDEDYREQDEESAKRPKSRAPPKSRAHRAPPKQRQTNKNDIGKGGLEQKRRTARNEDFGAAPQLKLAAGELMELDERDHDVETKEMSSRSASQYKLSEAEHSEPNYLDYNQDMKGGSSRSDHESVVDSVPHSASHVEMAWNESDLLAETEGLDNRVARNLVKLFEGDNTIPFIARYRKEMTGNMEPEQLRHAKETFEEIKVIQHKAATMVKNIEKLGKMNPSVRRSIVSAKSLSELDLINTPFKAGSKRTLAERARLLGLDEAARIVLEGTDYISLSHFINRNKDGLQDNKEVQLGIQHILADIISKDRGVLDFISELKKTANIRLESSRAKGTVAKELAKGSSKERSSAKVKSLSAAEKKKLQTKADEESKYRNYFEFGMNVKYLKPHQVLAINRGETQKELSVRVVVPDFILDKLMLFCNKQWLSKGVQYDLRSTLFNDSVKDSYNRLIQPLIVRQVRAELNQNAERASIEVFAVNLKKLLLMPPFRGRVVLGIDPGFRNGCKVALINLAGEVLEKGVFNLNCGKRTWDLREDPNAMWLRKIMARHRCEVIALGNGTACRETEEYLSELFQIDFFKPLDVSYTIVSEQGASIYSCSTEAKAEFPDLDPNLISAVSIARRLQDPLAELVKVEPKHLGVGMYQHDLPEKKLSSTLDEIVVECVSFVGVDLNTAPHCLLRRVAGLNSSRADKILEYRKKSGPFFSRDDVKKVKGIGEKSFEQCAGFIRIIPETVGLENAERRCNPLDMTWIHPESYSLASRILNFCHVKPETIGTPESIRAIAKALSSSGGIKAVAEKLDSNEALVKLIFDGLQMPINHDFRSEFEKPLFRKGLTSINELQSGDILTGRVTNTTHFGAFVDIGVGQNGLIHNSGMGGKHPQFGDRVQVKVLNVELSRQRIGLQLLAIL